MGTVIGLHARTTGPHYHSNRLRFGAEWKAHHSPEDSLEFSEYGRRPDGPGGGWLVICILAGALMWAALAAVLL